jgi:hypothetical protein
MGYGWGAPDLTVDNSATVEPPDVEKALDPYVKWAHTNLPWS